MGFKTAELEHDHLGLKYMGKDAARDFLFCVAVILREWINVQARNSPVLGIMVDESTDVSQKKVPQTDASQRLQPLCHGISTAPCPSGLGDACA